ncbi:helix-turn-helix transcriptional regulator [Nocardioides sp. GXZ039]|uniref:helix-turn-helix transcriptional regulator n=1 Tax=Nocardioides sp. GXZ039 TaxID=3136018 RepID=UPI0030F41E9E
MTASRLLSINQAAERLNRPVATLYDWRYKGTGPKSAKIGGKIAYRESDIDAWLEAQFAKAVGDGAA